jgi:hypothetical protein
MQFGQESGVSAPRLLELENPAVPVDRAGSLALFLRLSA